MEAHLRTILGVLSLTCLFHPSLSAIKSKLIVKVPHRIKHIHISHVKPVHVHTVESKKFHHHYHEGDVLAHAGSEAKGKEQRSSSNIKPIVWSPELHLEDLKRPEGALAFTLGDKPKRTRHFTKNNHMPFKQPNSYTKDHWELSPHVFQSSDYEDSQHAFSNQEWLRHEENVLRNKKNRGFSRGFRQSKGNHLNSKGKHIRLEQDESGWTPIMNFEDTIGGENNFKIHHGDQFFNSDSLDIHGNGEGSTYSKKHADITIPKKTEKHRVLQKNNEKGSWSNKYEQDYKKGNPFLSQGGITHQKTLSNLGDDLHSLEPSSFKYLKDSLLREIEPENPRTSFFQQKPLQNQKPEHQQVNLNIQTKQPKQQERRTQKKRLQPDVHQQTQQKKKLQPNVHQQEWHQQTVPTNHQQHFVHEHVLPAPVQGIIVNHKSTKKIPLSSASLIKTPSSHKPLQANSGVIEVNPLKPEVKWHQSVQTGKYGAGSYQFEVVNYSPSKEVTPGV